MHMVILLTGPPGLFREGVAALLANCRECGEVRVGDSLAAHGPHDPREPHGPQQRAPDCILMDGDDPGREHIELEAARVHARSTPLVVMLREANHARVGALIAAGVSGCVEKSAESGVLFDALRRALAGGVFLPDSLRAVRGNEAVPGFIDADPQPQPHLTPRQIEVLALLARGRSNKTIARQLDMAEATVKTHLSAVYRLLNVTSRGEASALAARLESVRDAQVDHAMLGRISVERLLAGAQVRQYRARDVLFRRGDAGGELFYVMRGTVLLSEIGVELGPGDVLGEIGLFSPERRRTATAVCRTGCELRVVGADDAIRLYYQEPEFALYLIRLLAGRLQADRDRRA
jgi:DNA-binding NarL/FixJ family response regulator